MERLPTPPKFVEGPRKFVGFNLAISTKEKLEKESERTAIPQSRIVELVLEDYFKD